MKNLNVSIVLYKPHAEQVQYVIRQLLRSERVNKLYLIDNSDKPVTADSEARPIMDTRVEYRFMGTNLGYGKGHNVALRESIAENIPFHLVMNSDILFEPDILDTMLTYMGTHEDVAMMMPKVLYPSGEVQRLCKLLPTPWDVFGRRFLLAAWVRKRNARYELHASGYDKMMNVPYLSGCFMLLRTTAAQQVGLFDERFFMYPEDIDLTRRLHAHYKTLFFPDVTIVHDHGQASYHSLRMLWIHGINMCKYFNKWGWLFDAERKRVNEETISLCRPR